MKILKILMIFILIKTTLLGSESHIYKNLDFLNLNKKQQLQLKKILISHKKMFEEYYIYKEKKENTLKKVIIDDYFDEDKYEDIVEDIQEEAIELEVKTLKRIHKILTKKQRVKFSNYLKEWKVE